MFVAVYLIFISFPLITYLVTGEHIVFFPIYIPFVHDDTDGGFVVLSSIHFVWITQVVIGLAGSDALMALLLLHILPISELFVVSVEEMNDALLADDPAVANSAYMKLWLRNLLQMHRELSS